MHDTHHKIKLFSKKQLFRCEITFFVESLLQPETSHVSMVTLAWIPLLNMMLLRASKVFLPNGRKSVKWHSVCPTDQLNKCSVCLFLFSSSLEKIISETKIDLQPPGLTRCHEVIHI